MHIYIKKNSLKSFFSLKSHNWNALALHKQAFRVGITTACVSPEECRNLWLKRFELAQFFSCIKVVFLRKHLDWICKFIFRPCVISLSSQSSLYPLFISNCISVAPLKLMLKVVKYWLMPPGLILYSY